MMRCPSVVIRVAALRRRAFSWENPDSGTKVSVGDAGLEEMRDTKEGVMGLAEELDLQEKGARTGRGCKTASVIGSQGLEVTISQ